MTVYRAEPDAPASSASRSDLLGLADRTVYGGLYKVKGPLVL
jgi:hypothetical protein